MICERCGTHQELLGTRDQTIVWECRRCIRRQATRGTVLILALLILVALMTTCAGGTIKPDPRFGEENVHIITEVKFPVSAFWWRSSKWYNQFIDTGTPTRVVISGELACVQDAGTTDDPREGHAFECKEGWRGPGGHPIRGSH